MKIDLFNHFFPKDYYKEISAHPLMDTGLMKRIVAIDTLSNLELRLEQIEAFGSDYSQVISLPGPDLVTCDSNEKARYLARLANEGMAELVLKYPGHFPAFIASLPMAQAEDAVAEARFAIENLGARGIQIFTNVNGKAIDGPEYFPLWKLLEDYGLPILLHPARTDQISDYRFEEGSRYGMWMTLGWPYETSVAMVRLVYAGIFEKFKKLKVVVHHAGAMIPMFWQRVNSTRETERQLHRTPSEYLKMFYADTALFGNIAGTECGIDYFGVDHMVFATDAPFGPAFGTAFISSAISVVESLKITDEDKNKIYSQNALKLLQLQSS